MTEEQSTQQQEGDQGTAPGESRPDVMAEFQALGQQLLATGRAIVEGPGKTFQREVSNALRELGSQLQQTVKTVQQRPETSEFQEKARKAAQQIQEAPILREIEETLVGGLQHIKQQLQRLSERVESQQAESEEHQAPAESSVQRLHIERDQPGAAEEPGTHDQPPG
jgi:exonuclease VII large subunit